MISFHLQNPQWPDKSSSYCITPSSTFKDSMIMLALPRLSRLISLFSGQLVSNLYPIWTLMFLCQERYRAHRFWGLQHKYLSDAIFSVYNRRGQLFWFLLKHIFKICIKINLNIISFKLKYLMSQNNWREQDLTDWQSK